MVVESETTRGDAACGHESQKLLNRSCRLVELDAPVARASLNHVAEHAA